jgi:L-alanine-DL-glutamate epimerase-like enolase superfamily enzyme
MAETYDIGVAPHCPLGPIAFAASLQIAFSTPNFVICEMSWKVRTESTALPVPIDRPSRSLARRADCYRPDFRCTTTPATLISSPT